MDFQKMMQQAQQVQFKMAEMQEKLKEIEVEGQSGGGMVKVLMTCAGEVRNITIDPSVISPDEKDTLEDLVVAAINSANDARDQRAQEETKRIMKELGLPEDMNLPL